MSENNKSLVFAAFADSLSGNRGAVSMLQSAIDNLTVRGVRINVFSVYYRRDRRLTPQPGVQVVDGTPLSLVFRLTPLAVLYRILRGMGMRRVPRCFGPHFAALAEADVALMIGGTTFSDAQKIKVIFNVFCMLPAILLGKKAIMYSQTMGPFATFFNRTAAKFALGRMDVVVPRGGESLACVRKLGLPERVKVEYYDDAAFSLVVTPEAREEARRRCEGIPRRRGIVGMSVNSIVQRKCRMLGIDYLGVFVKFTEYLAENDYTVLLIPHSMRPGAKTDHNNDLFAIDYMLERLSDKVRAQVVPIRENYDCKVLREVVGVADLYVASRFHSMISALCTGVPVLVFGWGYQKYREVMHEFELDDFCFDARDISLENLISGFERLVANREAVAAKIQTNLPAVAASSRRNHEAAFALATGGEIPGGNAE